MAIIVTTGFDPAVHGFHFRNRFSGSDVLGAVNVGLGKAAVTLSENADFWQGWGLCGGMSWAALDRFLAGEQVPARKKAPDPDSDLFVELVDRQLDSFRGLWLISRCADWQSRAEQHRWWDPRNTTWKMTMRQWPLIKSSIDYGMPASLTLIRTQINPSDNHQVLATGYCEDALGFAQIALYDPNHPDQSPTIALRLVGAEAGRAVQSTGEPLRGFFLWRHLAPAA
jgi:hypothetical protein